MNVPFTRVDVGRQSHVTSETASMCADVRSLDEGRSGRLDFDSDQDPFREPQRDRFFSDWADAVLKEKSLSPAATEHRTDRSVTGELELVDDALIGRRSCRRNDLPGRIERSRFRGAGD